MRKDYSEVSPRSWKWRTWYGTYSHNPQGKMKQWRQSNDLNTLKKVGIPFSEFSVRSTEETEREKQEWMQFTSHFCQNGAFTSHSSIGKSAQYLCVVQNSVVKHWMKKCRSRTSSWSQDCLSSWSSENWNSDHLHVWRWYQWCLGGHFPRSKLSRGRVTMQWSSLVSRKLWRSWLSKHSGNWCRTDNNSIGTSVLSNHIPICERECLDITANVYCHR